MPLASIMIWGVGYYLGWSNAFMDWWYVGIGLVKTVVGYGWWSLMESENSDFGVVDFFTFKEGRDTWMCDTEWAHRLWQMGRRRSDYQQVPDARPETINRLHGAQNPPLDPISNPVFVRRLIETKTWKMLKQLDWLYVILPVA